MAGKLLKPNGGRVTQDIVDGAISLVGAKLRPFLGWTQERRDRAYDWAIRTHLRASDNNRVRVPPMPDFLEPKIFLGKGN